MTWRIFRRRREGKTNYRRRLALIKSGLPRAIIRLTNKQAIVQIVDYEKEGDKTLASCTSKELEKLGWKASTSNVPSAYLTGYLCGLRFKNNVASKKGISVIPDLGIRYKLHKTKPYAVLKGLTDSGVDIKIKEDTLPHEDRLKGKHIEDYAKKASGNQFSIRKTVSIKITDDFKRVLENIKKIGKEKAGKNGN